MLWVKAVRGKIQNGIINRKDVIVDEEHKKKQITKIEFKMQMK